jgi:hypothetical protein
MNFVLLKGNERGVGLDTKNKQIADNSLMSTTMINPLQMKLICFIWGVRAYRAVNTLHFGYKNQSLNVL